ncbi:MAG: efflux RND transporter periplasmic adaptor subunit [bacterium]|nr:efflux RND transporter periplasmic adaptor subunit [bacterium]
MSKMIRWMSGVVLCLVCVSVATGQERPPAPVIVADVIKKNVRNEIVLVGMVQPRRSSLIASETDGLVIKRYKEAGQAVRQNDVLFRLNNDQLLADLVEARADVALQLFNYTQSEKLLKKEAVSEQDLRNSAYQLARARAKLQDLESRLKALKVVAPFSGHIVQTMTEVGEWVGQGDEIAQLISTDTVRVYVNVPERQVDRIQLGGTADVFLDALGSVAIPGKIVAVLAEGYADSHTFPVAVEVMNPDGRIRSHMAARVRFIIEESKASLLVHKDAVVNAPDGHVVFLAVDGKAVRHRVESGLAYQGYVAVTGDITAGDMAIVRGNERLQDGQEIKVIRKQQ